MLLLIFLAACSLPESTVTISDQGELTKAVLDVLAGGDARVNIALADAGTLLIVEKRGESVTLSSPKKGSAEVETTVAELRLKLSKESLDGCISNLKNIATALEMWSTDNQGRYPRSLRQLTPDYLKTLPHCPQAGSDTYSASYTRSESPDLFSLACQGDHHKLANVEADHPAYKSDVGLISGSQDP